MRFFFFCIVSTVWCKPHGNTIKKLFSALRDLGFKGGNPDPWLMTKHSNEGVIFIAIWVDDSLLVGDEKAIERTGSTLGTGYATFQVRTTHLCTNFLYLTLARALGKND